MSPDVSAMLANSVIEQFPKTADEFATSLASTMLSRISQCFWSLDYPASNLNGKRRAVELARNGLKAISTLSLPETQQRSSDRIEDEASPGTSGLSRRKLQRAKKTTEKRGRITDDRKAFDDLNVEIPGTKAEADRLAGSILEEQLMILKVSELYPTCTRKLLTVVLVLSSSLAAARS